MDNDAIQRNTNWVQTFDRILDILNLDAKHPVSILEIEDGREVVVVQPNPFTISRIYTTGRPDGKQPNGVNSYYDYFFKRLQTYEQQHGTRNGFQLESEEWDILFEEAFERYARYLLFAGIHRWNDVQRDTATNIAVTNFARQYAPPETAWQSYRHKGYMLMMNSIANAELSLKENDTETALRQIDTGIQQIGEFCGECLREQQDEAENVTRERYLGNLIEFRSEIETRRTETTEATQTDTGQEAEEDLLAELERLLSENDT